ncbi:MAG: MurR/RpiR family transcriptional regulator [Alphaproteobacteria bacterium]|nr:MurR/RpiR family transcriptional regulator [Alphaproteobacteria bacterium]
MRQPPNTAKAVIAALTAAFPDLPPALQAAARHIIDHPREVGVQSMRALAAKTSVHPNAFVRLARQIGFDGYEEMRERFRDFVVAGDDLGGFRDRARWLQEMAAKGGSAAILSEMAAAVADNVERGFRTQDVAQLEKACDAILRAGHVYVLGLGAVYDLAHQFWYVTRMAFGHIVPIPRHGSQPIDDLALVGQGDVLVALTFQPYRAEIMDAVRLAKRRGARVIGVTDSVTSPLTREADQTLICPTHTPQFFQSHAAVVGLLETLVALLVARAGEEAQARIEAFHAERLAAGIYEEDPRLGALG